MCPDPAARPRLADSVAVLATALVAVFAALATVVDAAASLAQPPMVAATSASLSAAPR